MCSLIPGIVSVHSIYNDVLSNAGVYNWVTNTGLQSGGKDQDNFMVLQHKRPCGVCPQMYTYHFGKSV